MAKTKTVVENQADERTEQPAYTGVAIVNGRAIVKAPTAGTALMQCPTSLDLTSWRGRALALAAGGPGNYQIDDSGQARIVATDYIIFPDERAGEADGEVSEFVRTVFIDASGKTFRTTAAHGASTLNRLLSLFTAEEWRRGIPLIITLRRTAKSRGDFHDIRVDPSYEPPVEGAAQ